MTAKALYTCNSCGSVISQGAKFYKDSEIDAFEPTNRFCSACVEKN